MTLNIGFMTCLPKELRTETLLYLTARKKQLLEKIVSHVGKYKYRVNSICQLNNILNDDDRLIRISSREIWDLTDGIVEEIDHCFSPKLASRDDYKKLVKNINGELARYDCRGEQIRVYNSFGRSIGIAIYSFFIIIVFILLLICLAIYYLIF